MSRSEAYGQTKMSEDENKMKVLSPAAMMALESVTRQDTSLKSFTKATFLESTPTGSYIRGIAKVDPLKISISQLSINEIIVDSKIDDIWTIRIPVKNYSKIAAVVGIIYFEADMPIRQMLDTATIASGANRNLFKSLSIAKYDGKNVVVGIVDSGFDYFHPSFKDSLGKSRIKYVWDQTMAGTNPKNFSYGYEITTNQALESLKTDNQFGTHGTHVLGIAAAGYFGKPFIGMAPNSDIILVAYRSPQFNNEYMSTSLSGVLDGVAYIFQKADELNKPAVVNLSLGFHMGPHDGTSLFDQACDKLVGTGKILVGAAGNEGARKIHLGLNFTSSDTTFKSFAAMGNGTYTSIDSWGEINKTYCVEISLYNKSTGTNASTTKRICTSDNTFTTSRLIGSDGKYADISIYAVKSSTINQHPRITIYINNPSVNLLLMKVNSLNKEPQKVNFWNDAYGFSSNFNSLGLSGYLDGDSNCSVGEIGGTGKRIISVAAYTTKNAFKSAAGSTQKIAYYTPKGEIAPFSSKGPTIDGRIKPDIAAPGNGVVSTLNSYNDNYTVNSGSTVMEKTENSRSYIFGILQGTSMSAPVVTGIIALLLQENPTLTPEQVKFHLNQGANRDTKTGLKGAENNNVWGYGKISATGALSSLLGRNINPTNISNNNLIYCRQHNSRLDGIIDVSSVVDEEVMLNVYNISGKIIYTDKFKSHTIIDLSNFINGIYIIKGHTQNKKGSSKIIINQ